MNKKYIIIAVVLIAIVALVFFMFKGKNTGNPMQTIDASAPTKPTGTKHLVQSGDTLIAIAKKYNTTVKAIAEANNIQDVNLIEVGWTLTIPNR